MIDLEHCTFARALFTWAARNHLIGWREHNYFMRDVIWHERRLTGCQGKDGFASYGLAAKVALRLGGRRDEPPGKVYRCKVCAKYHVAAATPDLRRARKQRLEELRLKECA